jgi:hypothetical protein
MVTAVGTVSDAASRVILRTSLRGAGVPQRGL